MSPLEGLPTVQVVKAGSGGEDESRLPAGSPRNGFPWPGLLQREEVLTGTLPNRNGGAESSASMHQC